MVDLYNAITGATQDTSLKDRLWQEIVLRLMHVSSGCTIPGHLLKLVSQTVPVPAKRPSGLVYNRIERMQGNLISFPYDDMGDAT
jgi:hypothetical protein